MKGKFCLLPRFARSRCGSGRWS